MSVVEYYGENPKTTQPSMFFPLFVKFIKAYKVKMQLYLPTAFDHVHDRLHA